MDTATRQDKKTPGDPYTLAERQKMQLNLHSSHVDVDEIHTADGLFSIISQRKSNGMFTFGIFKIVDRGDGQEDRTSFIPESMRESCTRLLQITLERIDKIRKSGKAPFKERPR